MPVENVTRSWAEMLLVPRLVERELTIALAAIDGLEVNRDRARTAIVNLKHHCKSSAALLAESQARSESFIGDQVKRARAEALEEAAVIAKATAPGLDVVKLIVERIRAAAESD